MNIYVGLGGYAIKCLAYLFKEKYIDDELIFIDSYKASDIFDVNLANAHCLFVKNSELTFDEYEDFKSKIDSVIYGGYNDPFEESIVNINILTTMCGNFGSSNVFIVGNLFKDYFEKIGVNYNISFLLIPKLSVGGSLELNEDLFNRRIDEFITLYQDSSFSMYRRDDRIKFYVPKIKNMYYFFHENDEFKVEVYRTFKLLNPQSKFPSIISRLSPEDYENASYSFRFMEVHILDEWINNYVLKRNKNNLSPYIGEKSYVFISYSHKDKKEVYPIIDKLLNDGFRIWYDDGIDPGTEWDENIAKHIEECGYFIPFISENYLKSSNCKDELNFARDLDKDRFLVYLQNINLPSGMNMRLSRLQNIHKYAYNSFDEFYKKLLTAKGIEKFK